MKRQEAPEEQLAVISMEATNTPGSKKDMGKALPSPVILHLLGQRVLSYPPVQHLDGDTGKASVRLATCGPCAFKFSPTEEHSHTFSCPCLQHCQFQFREMTYEAAMETFTKGLVKHGKGHPDKSVNTFPLKWINQEGRGGAGDMHGFSRQPLKEGSQHL